jgi:hypothetical protein
MGCQSPSGKYNKSVLSFQYQEPLELEGPKVRRAIIPLVKVKKSQREKTFCAGEFLKVNQFT